MPYVITVFKGLNDYYVYGLFETRRDASNWAEKNLFGYDWHVAQYTIVERI